MFTRRRFCRRRQHGFRSATYARRMNNERILRDGDARKRHGDLCHHSRGTD